MNTTTPKIIALAEELATDIRERNLQPGDRYLTTADASLMLGVGKATANRALQLLERRKLISRRQRQGAFIAIPSDEQPAPELRKVHFLVQQDYLVAEGIGNDQLLLGMQEELPGASVQISFLPRTNPDVAVRRLIDESLSKKSSEGFVLVSVPFEVQQLVSQFQVPAVVYGQLHPGVENLNRFSRDQHAIGQLASEFLLARGHQRIADINRQLVLPGDHPTMDAIRFAVDTARLPVGALIQRFLPCAASVYRAEVLRLLQLKSLVTGFIFRSRTMVGVVVELLAELGLELYQDVDIVLCDYYLHPNQKPQYVYSRPAYNSEEQGRRIGALLRAQTRGDAVESEIIPMLLDTSVLDHT